MTLRDYKEKFRGDAEEGSRGAQVMSTAGYRSGRTRKFFFIIVSLFLNFYSASVFALAEKDKKGAEDDAINFEYTTKRTKTGLTFQVPEDMPIESRNGIEAPMPFDQYTYGKFKKIDSRLERIEKALTRIELDIKSIKSSAEQSKP